MKNVTIEIKLINQGVGIEQKWVDVPQLNELPESGIVALRLVAMGRDRDVRFEIQGESVLITAIQNGVQANQTIKTLEEAKAFFATYKGKGYWVQEIITPTHTLQEVRELAQVIAGDYVFGNKNDDGYALELCVDLVEKGYSKQLAYEAVQLARSFADEPVFQLSDTAHEQIEKAVALSEFAR